jgi:hypothetical protein
MAHMTPQIWFYTGIIVDLVSNPTCHQLSHRVLHRAVRLVVHCPGHDMTKVLELFPVGNLLLRVAPRVDDLLAVAVQGHVVLNGEREDFNSIAC